MGRKRRNAGPQSMEAEVGRRLTDEELDERSRRLARLQVRLDGLRSARRVDAKRAAAEIKEAEEEVSLLASQIVEGVEVLRQGDIFATDGAGAEMLAAVAAVAGAPSPETVG